MTLKMTCLNMSKRQKKMLRSILSKMEYQYKYMDRVLILFLNFSFLFSLFDHLLSLSSASEFFSHPLHVFYNISYVKFYLYLFMLAIFASQKHSN